MCPFRFSLVLLLVGLTPLSAAIVWEIGGPGITVVTFDKDAGDNPFVASNQDEISPTVTLTRPNSGGGLINFADSEFSYTQFVSPTGTEWAFAGLAGNPSGGDFSASNFENLTFTNWQAALEGSVRDNIVGRDGVLHLLAEDVYLEIQFTDWGVGNVNNGQVTYIRASGSFVPEPGAVALLALAGLAGLHRRRRA